MSADNTKLLEELRALDKEMARLEEQQRKNKILFFRPLGNQVKFFKSKAQTRLLFGSNRSGKSVCSTVEEIAHALGYRPWLKEDHPDRIVRLANGEPIPVPNRGYHLLENLKVAGTQVFMPKMKEWLPDIGAKIHTNNLGHPTKVSYPNGSELFVLSQEQSTSSIEGASGHYAVSDEPPTRDKWIALTRGLIDYSGNSWIAATPIKASHYMSELITRSAEPNDDVELVSISIEDNRKSRGGYLDDEAVDKFKRSLRPDEIASRWYGKPSHLAGAVFNTWQPKPPYYVEPFDIPPHWPRIMAVDPAGRKPLAAVWAAVSPENRVYIYRELYDANLVTINQVSDWIKEAEGWRRNKKGTWIRTIDTEPVVLRIIDTSGRELERTSGLNIQSSFAQNGLVFMKAQKLGYLASIDKIKTMLQVSSDYEWASGPDLIVFNTCSRVMHEFMNFVWKPESSQGKASGADPDDKPLKTNDDCIDCIRYIVMLGATYNALHRMLRESER